MVNLSAVEVKCLNFMFSFFLSEIKYCTSDQSCVLMESRLKTVDKETYQRALSVLSVRLQTLLVRLSLLRDLKETQDQILSGREAKAHGVPVVTNSDSID